MTAPITVYDPYGQPLDPTTHAIGTTTADDHAPNNRSGWHQGAIKITDTTGTTAITEMGARLYVPTLGRFLQTDPIEGGVDNDYTWPTDPIGSADLDGTFDWLLALDIVATVLIFVPGVGTGVGLAFKATVVATRLVVAAVRASNVIRKPVTVFSAIRSTATKSVAVARETIAKNNVLRCCRGQDGVARVSLGAQHRHWSTMPQWRKNLQPWHIHIERTKTVITYNPTRKTWGWGRGFIR